MKRKALTSVAILIVSVLILTVLVACVNTDLSEYGYPEGFEEALASIDLERSENCDIRVMSYNILVHIESWGGIPVPPRAKPFLKILEESAPDVIGVQEMCDDWYKVLEANLGEKYEIIHYDVGLFNKNKSPIIYNKESLMLKESGYQAYSEGDKNGCRAITWAVFEVRDTGKCFAVTNTHLDLIREGKEAQELEIMNKQADELLAKTEEIASLYSCPVIACGDYNSMESADTPDYYGNAQGVFAAETIYKKLAASLSDLKYLEGTEIVCFDESKAFCATWDHIFAKGEAFAEKFYILDGEVFESVSDHFAVFADIVL